MLKDDKFQNKYRIPSARLQNWDYANDGAYFITICTKNREHYFGEIVESAPNVPHVPNVETRLIASLPPRIPPPRIPSSQIAPIPPPPTASLRASEMGKLAEKYWLEIPNHFPFIELGEFVVMPNHTHGILIIDKNANVPNVPVPNVETRLIASLPPINGGFAGIKNPMLHDNISRVIRWYKGRCSFEIRKIHAEFEWQPLFHDHVIRDAQSFENIQNYIANNPENWNKDKFNGNE